MNIQAKAILHNRFDIKVVDAKTGELKQEAVAYNCVTDQYFRVKLGLDSNIGTGNAMTYIGVGTGTGTPSVADTELFSELCFKSNTIVEEVYEYPTSYVTRQIILNADEYNGSRITEVGLAFYKSRYSYPLGTHAMILDSEGNQIAIEKTDVDVVYINATFYCTYTPSGFGDNGIYPTPENNGLFQWLLKSTYSFNVRTNRYPLAHSSDMLTEYQFSKSYDYKDGVGTFETLTYDLPLITVLDSEWNKHVVKSFGIPDIGAFQFPDVSAFPDYRVERLVVGEGDGVTTEFNIRCPHIKEGSVRVFVDSEELPTEAFEADCESNCVDARENYHTASMNAQMASVAFGNLADGYANTAYRYKDPLAWSDFPAVEYLYPRSCTVTPEKPIWIDFGEAKECNVLRIDNKSVYYIDRMVIEYSDDNETWTPVAGTREDFAYSSGVTYYKWTWDMVSARYWRVYVADSSWTYDLYYSTIIGTRDNNDLPKSSFFLGKSVPGLKLAVPPAPGETVEVSYTLDTPYKSENNILRMTCTIQLQRG